MIELMICGLIVSHPWTVVLFIAAETDGECLVNICNCGNVARIHSA